MRAPGHSDLAISNTPFQRWRKLLMANLMGAGWDFSLLQEFWGSGWAQWVCSSLQSPLRWFRPGKEKSPVAPAQCLCPSPGHSLQHQIIPKAKAPLPLLGVRVSFLVQSPRNSPLEPNKFQATENTPAFWGSPLDPQGLGIPVTAHPRGKISCTMMPPAEGNLRAPHLQTP